MSAKLSKEVTDRTRSGLWVLSAFETEGPEVAAGFDDLARPVVPSPRQLPPDRPDSRERGTTHAVGR